MRNHFAVWGSTREGMSESGRVAKAAYLDDDVIILITAGAVTRNDLPPGFQRFLTDHEMEKEGIDVRSHMSGE